MHNYLKKLNKLLATKEVPTDTITLVNVAHDDWCGKLKGGECNCNPDITHTEMGD